MCSRCRRIAASICTNNFALLPIWVQCTRVKVNECEREREWVERESKLDRPSITIRLLEFRLIDLRDFILSYLHNCLSYSLILCLLNVKIYYWHVRLWLVLSRSTHRGDSTLYIEWKKIIYTEGLWVYTYLIYLLSNGEPLL